MVVLTCFVICGCVYVWVCVCMGFLMCGCFDNFVGVLVICVLYLLCFCIVSFMYIRSYLLLSVRTAATE